MPEDPDTWLEPPPIVELDAIDSTNAEAMRRAARGERGPVWLTAARQTAGRGRSGRAWTSLDGNLMATLLVEPGRPTARLGELSLVAGVAAYEAVGRLHTAPGLRLKWPNDIMLGDAKLGGILIESTSFAGETVAAIGIGLNLVAAPSIADRETDALSRYAIPPARAAMLVAVSDRLMYWLRIWRTDDGFEAVRTAWIQAAGPPGGTMTINTGRAICSGAFAGLDTDGALLLRDDGGNLRRFSFGDVTLPALPDAASRGST